MSNIKTRTPNFKFLIPEFNTATWHDELEQNFRSIDALLNNLLSSSQYKGAWSGITSYVKNDLVFISQPSSTYAGGLFKVLVNHITPDEDFDTFYKQNPTYYEPLGEMAAQLAYELAKDWATKMNGPVVEQGEEVDYSSKYHASQAAISAANASTSETKTQQYESNANTYQQSAKIYSDNAETAMNTAQHYAERMKFGALFEKFVASSWQLEGNLYKLSVPGNKLVLGIFKLDNTAKISIQNVDVKYTDNTTDIYSLQPFDGFYLYTSSVHAGFEHVQTEASTSWEIEHNMATYPVVAVMNDENVSMICTITYNSLNKITLNFTEAQTGKAILR